LAGVSRKRIDYAGPLLKYAGYREPPSEPKKKRGRKALFGGKVTDMKPHQRHAGSLLRDIAEISIRYPALTRRGFTKHLLKLPQYKGANDRTLKRDVAEALARQENLLARLLQKHLSLEDWLDLVGIEPPTTISKLALRQKSLELLRKELKAQLK
jgi:hypothetical protein